MPRAFQPSIQPEGESAPRNSVKSLHDGEGGEGSQESQLLKQFENHFREADSWFSKWRKAAKRYYKTYAGDPWESGDRRRLSESERPAVNLNVSLATVNAIVGADMLERREVRFVGEDTDFHDGAVADWLTRVVRHQFNRCHGHRSDSLVLHDGLVTGLGFSRVFLDNRRWPFRLRVEHLHPWLCYPDPDATETNLSDRTYLIYKGVWQRGEIQARWGEEVLHKLQPSTLQTDGRGTAASPKTVSADGYWSKNDPLLFSDPHGQKFQVYEYEYLTHEPWVAYTHPDTGDGRMTAEEFEEAGDVMADAEGVEYPQEVWRRAFIAAATSQEGRLTLLEDGRVPIDTPPTACYTGFRQVDVDRSRVRYFGLMHVIHEPQLLYAKTLTILVEYFSRGAKGGAFIETQALEDPVQAREDWAKPGALILLQPGGKDKVLERKAVSWPNSMDGLLKLLREGITDISAVSDWLKGTATSERSNVLISNLQTQSMTVLAPALDPMSGFRMQQGLAMGQMAVKYLSVSALNKIIGSVQVPGITHQVDPVMPGQVLQQPDETGRMVPVPMLDEETGQPITPGDILRSVDLFEYDVQVDLGVASPTARQAFFAQMTQHGALDKILELGGPQVAAEILPELIKVSPLPPDVSKPLADKLKAALQAPSVEQMVQQLGRMSEQDRAQIVQILTQGGQGQPQPQPPQ